MSLDKEPPQMSVKSSEFRSPAYDEMPDPSEDWKEYFRLRMGKEKLLRPEDIDADELAIKAQAGREACMLMDWLVEDGSATSRRKIAELQKVILAGEHAKNDLVEANLGLVMKFANKYRGRGVPFTDLIQEANLGLVHAINTYDVNKPGKFGTWATSKILQYVIRSFYTQSIQGAIKQKEAEKLSKFSNVRRRLEEELGREASVEELAEAMNDSVEEILTLMYYGNDYDSVDREINEYGTRLGDILRNGQDTDPEKILVSASLRHELDKMIADLTPQEQVVIRGMFGLDDGEIKNTHQLRSALKVRAEAIKVIGEQGLAMLRLHQDVDDLRDYLY